MYTTTIKLHQADTLPKESLSYVYLCEKSDIDQFKTRFPHYASHAKHAREHKLDLIALPANDSLNWLALYSQKETEYRNLEAIRKSGNQFYQLLVAAKPGNVVIDGEDKAEHIAAFAEGIYLSSYQFLKYKKPKDKDWQCNLYCKIDKTAFGELLNVSQAVFEARTLVNEPLSYLTATKLAAEAKRLAQDSGLSIEVFDKHKIESLKMGGLLAVNKGSLDPPTFTILEWKPKNAVNEKPYIIVGKGIVYDTGGLSLKPTANSMDTMKCDMAGAAAAIGGIYAVAKSQLPVHVIALIPATDNRPSGNAYAPGDVVKMFDGTYVEVLNTDAEGRMILADALSYAKKYKPQLVIDLATLTGSAVMALGKEAIAAMRTCSDTDFDNLKNSGEQTYERLVELPLWEEYAESLKSDIADLKNIGGREAGAITAGKFLQHFTDYPWVHLDIAAPAFLSATDSYRGKNGTGAGVRLLHNFFRQISKSK